MHAMQWWHLESCSLSPVLTKALFFLNKSHRWEIIRSARVHRLGTFIIYMHVLVCLDFCWVWLSHLKRTLLKTWTSSWCVSPKVPARIINYSWKYIPANGTYNYFNYWCSNWQCCFSLPKGAAEFTCMTLFVVPLPPDSPPFVTQMLQIPSVPRIWS